MSKKVFGLAAIALPVLVAVLAINPSAEALFPAVTVLPGAAMQAAAQIPNMSQVSPNFYRGGMPNELGLIQLKQAGIQTIVSLANEKKYLEPEQAAAKRLGLRFVYIPLSTWRQPNQNDIDAFLQVVERKDTEPVFVHCVYGRDRTGTMVGMYRMEHDGWSPQQAYSEMLDHGFRKILFPLTHSVFGFGKRLAESQQKPVAAAIQ